MHKAVPVAISKVKYELMREAKLHITEVIEEVTNENIDNTDYLLFLWNAGSHQLIDFYEDFVARSAEQSSNRERLADEAERTVDDLKKAEYMTRFIGEEFEGIISGMTENGIFVQLENKIEGMVMIDDLPTDKYTYDETKWMITGKNYTFKLGQKIRIKVFSTDLIIRKVNFVLADEWQVKK